MYNLRSRQVQRKESVNEQTNDHRSNSSIGIQSTCSICFELIDKNTARLEPCDHLFHVICALNWSKVSSKCAVCRANVNKIDFQVDKSVWRMVWVMAGRFFALVQWTSNNVLSIGTVEANASLVIKVNGIEKGVFAMDKSDLPDNLVAYICKKQSQPSVIYYIIDNNGIDLPMPKIISAE